ncbi:MAG: extracellular solute-binding protein, partial [Gammaproteobacteria bacterium]|nr:extracellular solute-binding protein [Gammaproteobacteria bacterium]
MKPFRTLFAVAVLALVTATPPAFAAGEVNLYSARKEELIKPLLDRFTADTGIKVNLVTGKADALLKRLESEGRNTPADLLLTTDAGRLYRAYEAGLLQPVRSDTLERAVPAIYRDPEGHWFGVSVRARVLMFASDRLDPAGLSTYEDLADERWKGRICIRSSNNIYNQSLVASLIVAHGEAETEAWAKGLIANLARPPKGGDRDQIKAVAAGQCDVAVANTYYLGTMLNSSDPAQREAAAKISVFWPNQADRGSHVNVSGAGVTRH